MSNRVFFFDTTLRDGEQSPGATMNLQEKLRIAHQLEVLGVDIMEAGFPASSQGDFESVQRIARQAKSIQVAGLCRCMDSDIDRCWEAVKDAKNPRIHTFLSTSPLHMKYKLRKDPEVVLQMIEAGVRRCAGYTDNVEFSAEDASRSERDFLCRVVETAIKAGATTINLPDTVGYAQPQEFADLIRYVIENTPNSDKAIFSVHCHNDLGLAVANTLAALSVGARQAEVTISGIGERAGNAALEELAMALRVRKDYYGLEHGIVTEQLYPSCRLLSMTIGQPIPNNKAIVGANAFAHESGIHQDGMLKNRETYEIMTPQSVGRNESNLVIGKHSGRNAVRNKFESLGYSLDDDQLQIVFEAVKALADRKKTLHDDDLMALVQEEVYRMPDLYRLRHVSVQSSDAGGVPPTAAVLMDVDGMEKSGAGFGVGPVDAIFNVINDMLGREPQLEQYAVNAVTGGTDALGEVTVRLREGEFSAVGRGAHPDILVATARAYVNALTGGHGACLCERPQPSGQEGKGRRASALPAQLAWIGGGEGPPCWGGPSPILPQPRFINEAFSRFSAWGPAPEQCIPRERPRVPDQGEPSCLRRLRKRSCKPTPTTSSSATDRSSSAACPWCWPMTSPAPWPSNPSRAWAPAACSTRTRSPWSWTTSRPRRTSPRPTR